MKHTGRSIPVSIPSPRRFGGDPRIKGVKALRRKVLPPLTRGDARGPRVCGHTRGNMQGDQNYTFADFKG
jgi:hypothetical protein